MSQQRTLHGFPNDAELTPIGGPGESKFVPIGARVGQSGQVFETDGGTGRGGLVVKLLTWGATLPEQAVLDFTREVITVANLRHPHVAQVVDVGTLGDGTPFVVMERLAGMTLEEAASGQPVAAAEILPILRGVASALSAAHAVGITHGQVRADNVFIAQADGYGQTCVKLLDFGVARLEARPGPQLGSRAAERADQLALATLAWRWMGGMAAPAVERVLSRALSPDPSQRFGTVMAFVEALEEAFVSAATPNRLAVARPPSRAPATTLASAPSSLTQQFFAAGDELENAQAEAEDEDDELEASAARVPRSRPQMILAALLALASVTVIGWTVVSLADRPAGGSQVAETSPPPTVARPAVLPAPLARVAAQAPQRDPRGNTIAVGRGQRMRAQPPAGGLPPTSPPALPSADPPTAPAPAPAASAAVAPPAPTPDPAPAEPSTEGAAQPGDQGGSEQSQAAPPPSDHDETAPAPSAPSAEPPTPPAPDSPPPSEPAPPPTSL